VACTLLEGLLHRGSSTAALSHWGAISSRHALGHGQVHPPVAARTTGSHGAKRPPAAQALRAATVERRAGGGALLAPNTPPRAIAASPSETRDDSLAEAGADSGRGRDVTARAHAHPHHKSNHETNHMSR